MVVTAARVVLRQTLFLGVFFVDLGASALRLLQAGTVGEHASNIIRIGQGRLSTPLRGVGGASPRARRRALHGFGFQQPEVGLRVVHQLPEGAIHAFRVRA
eukprot:CAMPEP_0179005148 /NCGR_PEP_ID=MMETSP0795-20121207/13743_1 /TAXON_ID=88552 /ORGANISM="Amoebophrya sp., Strain Ameob2" /LENGTH=100 /DNA_ID=CAMNT_0020699577 /DNA_START=372 /DNA_END=674 /DNA_ORIENTATION=-